MEDIDWLQLILLALTASVKFAIFVPITIVSQQLGFWEALLFSFASGSFGVLMFMFLSDRIIWVWNKIKSIFTGGRKAKKRRIFTRRNRKLVKLKKSYGLPGIAFLTPVLISIPIGSFLAVRYFKNKKRVLLFMELGVLFWSVIFALFAGTIKAILESMNLA